MPELRPQGNSGRDKARSFRLYFAVDQEQENAAVGHLPTHLPDTLNVSDLRPNGARLVGARCRPGRPAKRRRSGCGTPARCRRQTPTDGKRYNGMEKRSPSNGGDR